MSHAVYFVWLFAKKFKNCRISCYPHPVSLPRLLRTPLGPSPNRVCVRWQIAKWRMANVKWQPAAEQRQRWRLPTSPSGFAPALCWLHFVNFHSFAVFTNLKICLCLLALAEVARVWGSEVGGCGFCLENLPRRHNSGSTLSCGGTFKEIVFFHPRGRMVATLTSCTAGGSLVAARCHDIVFTLPNKWFHLIKGPLWSTHPRIYACLSKMTAAKLAGNRKETSMTVDDPRFCVG